MNVWREHPESLVITIGDTQVDFPMHVHADLAYHVGKEKVWKEHPLAHCHLITDRKGQDSQHVSGTLCVLKMIRDGIGYSLYDWKIPLIEERLPVP